MHECDCGRRFSDLNGIDACQMGHHGVVAVPRDLAWCDAQARLCIEAWLAENPTLDRLVIQRELQELAQRVGALLYDVGVQGQELAE